MRAISASMLVGSRLRDRDVRESGKSVPTVARELDLTETALRSWVRQAEIDAGDVRIQSGCVL